MSEGELIAMIRGLVGDDCPSDLYEDCFHCHGSASYRDGRYRLVHADDCPWERARRFLEARDAERAAVDRAIGAGI